MLDPGIRDSVRSEAERLLNDNADRRDLRLATTDYTRRSMSVVQSQTIATNSALITHIYRDPQLIATLEAIAAERLHPCPKADEEFLITCHEQAGDTHGWHWGDFSFALIWVLVAPPMEIGGLLQW
jgi:L-lysine 4-chlorinase